MARLERYALPSWLITLAAAAIIVAALHFAQEVLIPFTLAILFSFLLAPICDVLERWRLGRIPSVILTSGMALLLIALLTWTVISQLTILANNLPQYKDNITEKADSIKSYVDSFQKRLARTTGEIEEKLAADTEEEEEAEAGVAISERTYTVRVKEPETKPLEIIGGMFGTLFQVLATSGLVIILVIFFLIRREDLRDRFIRLIGRGQVSATTQAMDEAASRVSRYLMTQLFINATYGAPVAIGLYFLGIPNAVLWGVLATVLRFIPYLGPWIAAAMPIALSLAVSRGWTIPLLTIGLFLVLELFSNNVMEPWLYGSQTGVSPVAILVAAVFWTWLWGSVGLLLATPLTVCLVVLGKYVPQLSFLGVLLGDQPVFDRKTRLYQRLLAADQQESAELIEEYLDENPLGELYDKVLLPALGKAERDHYRGELDDARHHFVRQAIREVIEELGDRYRSLQAEAEREHAEETGEPVYKPDSLREKGCVLCLPARDVTDELAAMMFAQLLDMNGYHTASASTAVLVSEMVDLVDKHQADVVCISAMPPATVAHTRYLCKRLLARFPNLRIIVGFWGNSDLSKAKARLGADGAITIVGTLTDAVHAVRRIKQPVVHRVDRSLEKLINKPAAPFTDAAKRVNA